MMKNNGLFKRILLMGGITLIILAIFAGGVFLYYRQRTVELTDMIDRWEESERSLYTFTERELTEEQIEEKCNEVCGYYSEEYKAEVYQRLYDAVAEISTDARTLTRYERIVTDVRADYRYGGIRVYMDCVIDYEGYGGYLIDGEEEDIEKRGKCTYTFEIEKTDDDYIITAIKTEWEE